LTCYNQAIELSADYALAYAFRGYIAKECELSENEDYDNAILFSTKAIERGKATFNDYYARAWAYNVQGKYDLALKDYDKAIALDPKYANAYNNRGLAYKDQGKLDLAIKDYDKAIELNPKYANAYGNRGNAYYAQGKFDNLAIKDYDKAIALNPKEATAYNNRGVAYYYLPKEDKLSVFAHIVSLGGNFKGLKYLNDKDMDMVVECLSSEDGLALTTLDMQDNKITDKGLSALINATKDLWQLEEVRLSGNSVGKEKTQELNALCIANQQFCSRIKPLRSHTKEDIHLDFSDITLRDVHWDALKRLLKDYSSPITLTFSGCGLDDVDLEEKLLPILKDITTLLALDISHNHLTILSIDYLRDIIKDGKLLTLTDLNVTGNRVEADEKEFIKIEHSLASCDKLTSLDISQNFLKKKDMTRFTEKEGIYRYGIFTSQKKNIRSLLAPQEMIKPTEWRVALACKKDHEHAQIFMEGMDKRGQRFIERHDITAEGQIGTAVVNTNSPNLKFFDADDYHMEVRSISNVKGKRLRSNVDKERSKTIDFSKFASVYTKEKVNCLKWALARLAEVDIIIDDKLYPSSTAKQDGKCVVM
jgi:hypothetical protein